MDDPAVRWNRIQSLFHAALALPASERAAFLEAECASEPDVRAQVQALLTEDERGSSLLDRPLGQVASDLLGPSNTVPPRIGPYRILTLLGHGGMGVVYLAEREDLGNRVAIKILRDAWLSPTRRERFASEQRTLAQLNHPSIARLYDADVLPDGTPYFVMEYVEGVPLTEYCSAHLPTIPERLRLFREICDAVQHAHRQTIIHRDLKPSNILVTADGAVKLLDFGISKQLEGLDSPVDPTQTGFRLMTPAYAAPEQVRGEPVGLHTDVYALGVILYELLTGRLPFDLSNRTPGQVEAAILDQDPERPSVAAHRMRDPNATGRTPVLQGAGWTDLDVLCLTAMHKDPLRRYRTVEALARDLDHYLKQQPLEARADSASYRAGKFLRRNWRAVSMAAVVLVAIVGLVAFYTLRLARARDNALTEAARTQRIQAFMLNLFQGGDEAVGPADTLRVITLLDRGLQQASVLDGDPARQAEVYQTLGGIYQKLGHMERADSLIGVALAQRRRVLGGDAPETANSLIALGLVRLDQANLDEAEQLIRDGLAVERRRLDPGHPAIARGLNALGRVLEERGVYDSAAAVLQEAVRLQSAGQPGSADLSSSLSELANVNFYAGNLDVSDSLNRVVLAMNRRWYGERHPLIADGLINLGASQFQRGNYAEAEKYDRQALDMITAYYGEDHPETASALTLLARALLFERRQDEAVVMLRRSLAIQQRVYGNAHPRVASALNELGNAALQRDDFAAAESAFTRMIAIERSVYGDRHYLVGVATSNLASVLLAEKQYTRAEALFRNAIALLTQALSADNMNTAIARIKLGRTLLHEARFAEAEVESRAGYDILSRQSNPSVSWLKSARTDLVMLYDSLKAPEQAARFRAELADSAAGRRAGSSGN